MSRSLWLLQALNSLPLKESIQDDILMESQLDYATDLCVETEPCPVPQILPVSLKGQENMTIQNWAHIESCKPKQYFEPETVEDVGRVIEHCRKNNWKLRVFGTGHSPNNIAMTEDCILSLRKMNRIENIDKEQKTVIAQGGTTIKQLNQELAKHQLGLSSLGSISEQTIAGAISTGTHGTGINFAILGANIVQLELFTATGERLLCSETEQPDIFKAAVCGLGCLGIIVKVKIQCEKAFRLYAIQEPLSLDKVLDNMDDWLRSAEHWRFWWFPHTDKCVVWTANRTERPKTPQPSFISAWFKERLLGYHSLEAMLYLATFAPSLIPIINRLYFRLLFDEKKEKVDQSDKVFNFDCLFRQYVDEWAIPRRHTVEAMKRLRNLIETSGLYVHFPIEVRFTSADDIWLSPSYGRESCWIGIIMYRPYSKDVPFKYYFEQFEQIMQSLDGRPHWAKPHGCNSSQFSKMYPRFLEFKQIRERLDPEHIFSNQYIDRVLDG
ncbi:L-gulonolactone oxidase [Galdieria sulphuraria]|uniref:L-gulonolactone oxidase n=1 Tax=Galdieria sulphuraria TaxID=130081 RepID=M2Y3E6_GALSU|nr:D-arabinono-1,4-lactone oxidase [Galdieria sulphuraria]EME30498.1 D-arabinono-1,4-lactone oxidase [Galdieria sulphuraria]GJD06356.1 L-gulonolactone oxidase [Galdieria sulphuraria]|eukprot:XP_005707018.1 D-arabinono-1,4-lactone oxidase [Galdieria sulphuraria]